MRFVPKGEVVLSPSAMLSPDFVARANAFGVAEPEHVRRVLLLRRKLETVSAKEVDEYLRGLDESKRRTLEGLRRTILEIVPEAEEVISYGVPAFRLGGKAVAGFAAFKNHLSYLPFSGSVIEQLPNELDRYTTTKSSVHFSIDQPLPKALVKKLIQVRLADIARRAS